VDTLLWRRLLGYDLAAHHEPWLPGAAFAWQVDLPRAAEAGLDGAVLGLVVTPREERSEQLFALKVLARLERGRGIDQTLATLDLLADEARAHPELAFATSAAELRRALEAGRFAALAGLEGAHGIESDLHNLAAAHARGLRVLGLVHFQASAAGYPMTEPGFADRGLTPFGFDLIAEMERLGVALDLAHLNARGVDDALAAARRPALVSHSACASVHPDPRNLADAQIRRIADAGGVVGLACGRRFLGPGGLDAFVAHADHAVRVGGAGVVALGSDWDGGIVPVPGLEDVRGLPRLTDTLLRHGWRPDGVRALLGENALRVLDEALERGRS
jgi:membrane dipeptidase